MHPITRTDLAACFSKLLECVAQTLQMNIEIFFDVPTD